MMKPAGIRWALLLFGIAFGYLEASVVVYLRAVSEPVRARLLSPEVKQELFPLLNWNRLQTESPETAQLARIEVVRELATLVMLAAPAALVAGRSLWLPSFALMFGAWDAAFYLFLKILIDWPSSLLTWDLLFLVPVPWTGPVLAPLLVSIALMGCGWVAIGRRVWFRTAHWVWMVAGNVAILASFTVRFREVMDGAIPSDFAWPLFSAGWIAAVAAFVHARRLNA